MEDDTPHPERPWNKESKSDRPRRERDEADDDRPRRRRRDEDDEYEEDDRPRRRRRNEPDPALNMVVPLNTSFVAIIAGYVGLISVLCLPAPFALLLGILALVHLKRNPKLDGKVRAIFAIVMGVVFSIPLVLWVASLALGGLK